MESEYGNSLFQQLPLAPPKVTFPLKKKTPGALPGARHRRRVGAAMTCYAAGYDTEAIFPRWELGETPGSARSCQQVVSYEGAIGPAGE